MEDKTPTNSQVPSLEGSYSNSIIKMKDQQAIMKSFHKILSCKREREFHTDSKIVVSMMKNLGIDECDKDVVDNLMEFNNYESILLILKEAKSRAAYANKDTIGVNDIQTAIQMAKYVGYPRYNKLVTAKPLLPNNSTSELENPLDEPHFSTKNYMDIIDNTTSELINMAEQTLATEKTDIPIQILDDQDLDDLLELTCMDLEEVIKNPQNPQNKKEEIKYKVNGFNVDSLLNDPHSL